MKPHTLVSSGIFALVLASSSSSTASDPITGTIQAGRAVHGQAVTVQGQANARTGLVNDAIAGVDDPSTPRSPVDWSVSGTTPADTRAYWQQQRDRLNGLAAQNQALMNAQQNEMNALVAQLRNPPPGSNPADLQNRIRGLASQIAANRNVISQYHDRAANFQDALDGRPSSRTSSGGGSSSSAPPGEPPPDLDGGYASDDNGRIYLTGSDTPVRGWIIDQNGNLVRETVQNISRGAGQAAAESASQNAARAAAEAAARNQAGNAGSAGHTGGFIPRGPRHIRPPPPPTVCPPVHTDA